MNKDLNDIELWGLLSGGNRLALNAIYSRHFSTLYQYGMRIMRDQDTVQDCIQNLFVTIWINHNRYGEVHNLKSYLISALRNIILSYKAVESRVEEVDIESYDVFDLRLTVESEFIRNEENQKKSAQILAAMESLTARQREIIYLKYFEEFSYEQISEIMDLTVNGAYKLSARALDALRTVLNIDQALLLAILLSIKQS